MKERLTNNLGLKLLSIFLAFFVWLVVVNISNPRITGTKVVTVEVLNEESLSRAQLTYSIVEKNTITVRYQVRTVDEYKIKSSDFKAYIDLNDLYEATGSVPVQVEVVNNKELIESVEAKPEVLHVETENLQRKRFDLQVNTVGELTDGYALGTTTLNTEEVFVRGPESVVGQINSVGIEIDVEGAVGDLAGTVEPKFYDANGNQLSLGDKVSIDAEEIEYQTQMLKVKNLTLNFDVEGTVADGYRYTGIECEVQSIPIVGLKSVLASLNSITIPAGELNMEGAAKDKVVQVDINQYLPVSTKLVGDKNMIEITMKVEKLVTKAIVLKLGEVVREGQSSHYTYDADKESTEVLVRGLKEDLDKLKPEELKAYIDVTGLQLGLHNGILNFRAEDGYQIVSYRDFKIEVAERESVSTSETAAEPSETVEKETGN